MVTQTEAVTSKRMVSLIRFLFCQITYH